MPLPLRVSYLLKHQNLDSLIYLDAFSKIKPQQKKKYTGSIRLRTFSLDADFTLKSYGWALLLSTFQFLTLSRNYRAQEAHSEFAVAN